jgi:hypothetical protein
VEKMANTPNPKVWYRHCKTLYRGAALRDSIPPLVTFNQFGFLPKHSTTDQLTYLLHELHSASNQRKHTVACFLDLAAAFDTVPHAAILHKLPAYGIRGHVLRWIANFLHERKQHVSVDGHQSPTGQVLSGVPQGSVIAPTLFLVFMNDLSRTLNECPIQISSPTDEDQDHLMYADDTMVFLSGHNLHSTTRFLNSMLLTIDQWATTWSMRFNHSKTSAMLFNHPDSTHPNIIFAGHHVKVVQTHKHLGFTISEDLSYTPHIDTICRKAASEIFLLKRLSLTCHNRTILQRVYKSFILPVFEYASPAWTGLSVTDKNRLERLQRRAVRIILGLPYTHPLTDQEYSNAPISLLNYRRTYASACYGYKLINHLLPPKLDRLIPCYTDHRYPTRNPSRTLPGIPIRSRHTMDLSPIIKCVRLINSLPPHIRAAGSLGEFKSAISTVNLNPLA